MLFRSLLNIKEDARGKYRKDWMKCTPMNIHEIKGISWGGLVPCELELDIVSIPYAERTLNGPLVEQVLRERLERIKRAFEKERQQAALRMEEYSAARELDEAISEHIDEGCKEAIRQLIEQNERLLKGMEDGA